MGKNNRERRAAKQKARKREARQSPQSSWWSAQAAPTVPELANMLWIIAAESNTSADSRAAVTRYSGRAVEAAADLALRKLFDSLFTATVERSVSVSNTAGWNEGRAAADVANLGVDRTPVR